jgi:hypothetical protein
MAQFFSEAVPRRRGHLHGKGQGFRHMGDVLVNQTATCSIRRDLSWESVLVCPECNTRISNFDLTRCSENRYDGLPSLPFFKSVANKTEVSTGETPVGPGGVNKGEGNRG